MSNDLKAQARRLLDVRVVVAFIAGFFAYPILMALWHTLVSLAIVVGVVWLAFRWLARPTK